MQIKIFGKYIVSYINYSSFDMTLSTFIQTAFRTLTVICEVYTCKVLFSSNAFYPYRHRLEAPKKFLNRNLYP